LSALSALAPGNRSLLALVNASPRPETEETD
jgi:hypothetical protein